MFQNGVKAIEEILEVATHSPKYTFIFFKAETKELLSKMLSQLTEWYSWDRGMRNTSVSHAVLHSSEDVNIVLIS